jgi:hypothetical protein
MTRPNFSLVVSHRHALFDGPRERRASDAPTAEPDLHRQEAALLRA